MGTSREAISTSWRIWPPPGCSSNGALRQRFRYCGPHTAQFLAETPELTRPPVAESSSACRESLAQNGQSIPSMPVKQTNSSDTLSFFLHYSQEGGWWTLGKGKKSKGFFLFQLLYTASRALPFRPSHSLLRRSSVPPLTRKSSYHRPGSLSISDAEVRDL
jgi:hypothetical protein